MTSGRPNLWVFAGPNGAGKSTLVERYRVADVLPVVNPDVIAKEIRRPGESELSAYQRAGRAAVQERAALLAAGKHFAIETTLSGKAELRLMKEAKHRGYKVNLVFVGVADARQSNVRVTARVRVGGHDVAEKDIQRRFEIVMQHLPDAMRLCDRVRVVDNSGDKRRVVLKIDNGKVRAVSRTLPEWAKAAIPREMRTLSKTPGKGISM